MIPCRNPKYDQPLVLLGHQRGSPNIDQVLDRWNVSGPVGLVSAGWEEDEVDDGWVRSAIRRPLVNSRLYELADQLFAEDPEVLRLLRERQDELRRLREVNRVQLDHLLAIARDVLKREFAGERVEVPERVTFEQIQQVDREYLALVTEVIQRYDQLIGPKARPSVHVYRERVLGLLAGCEALLIAGGHVGVLLNRLNLSRLLRHLKIPVIAWSGGAMAMGDKLVFFHQFVPHGSGDAELSRHGMRWFHSQLVFPRARERLNLGNRVEMALLARRFGGDDCLLLGEESELEWSATSLVRIDRVQRLERDGSLREARL